MRIKKKKDCNLSHKANMFIHNFCTFILYSNARNYFAPTINTTGIYGCVKNFRISHGPSDAALCYQVVLRRANFQLSSKTRHEQKMHEASSMSELNSTCLYPCT